jgi:hypothetical protein
MKTIKITFISFISAMLLSSVSKSDDLIHYSENGSIQGRYQCDEINVHQSPHQDTLICSKTPKIALNVHFKQILNDSDYQACSRNRDCVLIENDRDPNWFPVALYGIPDASFGRYARGSSCVRIQETVPKATTWAKESWKLCTNDPYIELAYTFALGHKHENIDRRFKDDTTKRVCFGDVLNRYKNGRYWTDNCIFVRQK